MRNKEQYEEYKMKYDKVVADIKQSITARNEKEAISCAKQLLEKMEIKTYPTPIVEVLNDLGFAVYAQRRIVPNISGYIVVDMDLMDAFNTDRVISIDRDDSLGRQRFTLAHELGHYLFDFDEKQLRYFNTYDDDRSDTELEKVPSRFAAEFLMPEKFFRKRCNELKGYSNYYKVRTLMQDFQVSQKAVLKRFEELGIMLDA